MQNTLYQQIGQLKVELDWVKKKLDCSVEQKRQLVELAHPQIRVLFLLKGIRMFLSVIIGISISIFISRRFRL